MPTEEKDNFTFGDTFMNYVVNGVKHERVFNIFEDICAIPHGSGNEMGVAKYIVDFAAKRGIEASVDSLGNVFLTKPARAGYENLETVLLQGHTDMVCEKNSDVEHNFLTDGLKLFYRDGLIGAVGTSLGADNGIAVAFMLALLDEDTKPALEMLFTVCEETGLEGARGFDTDKITATKMINLDSEEDTAVTAGCAGGHRTEFEIPFVKEGETCAYKLAIKGLMGGHSGADINSGRVSAVTLMARLLSKLYIECGISLVDITCSGKDNAIARECYATIGIDGNEKSVIEAIMHFEESVKKELCTLDAGFTVTLEDNESKAAKINDSATERIIGFMCGVKTGVIKMSNDISGLVEFSRNLGIIETVDGKIIFSFSTRSSLEAQLDASERELDILGRAIGADVSHHSRYPGWEYIPASTLRDEYIDAFETLFGTRPTVGVIHAGLECGIISSKTGGRLDIISVGPNLYDIHSPKERCDVASCEKIYDVLLTLFCK